MTRIIIADDHTLFRIGLKQMLESFAGISVVAEAANAAQMLAAAQTVAADLLISDLTMPGTGYTGEDGVECAVPAEHAGAFWEAVLAAGVVPAGLGARDTLRLEAGLPLHGHELGPGITTLQAGLGWVVSWDKGDFRGRAPLAAEKERGVARRLRGLEVEGRRPPRADQVVLVDGQPAGVVTSGNFSPMLERGIALAFVPPSVEIGDEVAIDVRGTAVAAQVVKTPFVRPA